jgi:hypothetical protein
MSRPGTRDNQRSRVYAWEAAAVRRVLGLSIYAPEYKTLDECAAFADPVWVKERGRVGRAKIAAPSIERPNWGQRKGIAHHGDGWVRADNGALRRTGGRITLPKWARSRWVILHEMAHRLTPKDEAHGGRFVGVLMGLAARWLDADASMLMELADEHGVRFHVRSIGVVPVNGPAYHVRRALRDQAPMSAMDLACYLSLHDGVDVTVRQVRGAAVTLIRLGEARWLRGKLTPPKRPDASMTPGKVIETPKRKGPWQIVRERAAAIGAEIERDGPGSYWLTHPAFDELTDPLDGARWCRDLGELSIALRVYEEHFNPNKVPA